MFLFIYLFYFFGITLHANRGGDSNGTTARAHAALSNAGYGAGEALRTCPLDANDGAERGDPKTAARCFAMVVETATMVTRGGELRWST